MQHLSALSNSHSIKLLSEKNQLNLKEAGQKEKIEKGNTYIATLNDHLLIEKDNTFSLTKDERVNFARPFINVLIEKAAEAYKNKLIEIVLTGSNSDGSQRIKRIKECGGQAIVKDLKTASSDYMPKSAIVAIKPYYFLLLEDKVALLIKINHQKR